MLATVGDVTDLDFSVQIDEVENCAGAANGIHVRPCVEPSLLGMLFPRDPRSPP